MHTEHKLIEISLADKYRQLFLYSFNVYMWTGKYHVLPGKPHIRVISIDMKAFFIPNYSTPRTNSTMHEEIILSGNEVSW